MNKQLTRKLLPGIITSTLLAGAFLPSKPALADGLLQDIGVGAAANVVTGVILDDGSVGENAVGGAAAGALINILK